MSTLRYNLLTHYHYQKNLTSNVAQSKIEEFLCSLFVIMMKTTQFLITMNCGEKTPLHILNDNDLGSGCARAECVFACAFESFSTDV